MWGEGKGLGERQGPVIPRPSVLQRLDDPSPRPRDFAVAAGSHEIKNQVLDPGVLHVKTGTPIRPTRTGWVVCSPTEAPAAYAGNHHTGGETFNAYRALTLESYQRRFWPGDRYGVTAVDDYGNITLTEQPDGPYLAISESQIVLDVRAWKVPVVVAPTEIVVVPTEEVVMPQLQSVLDEHHADDEFEPPEEDDDGDVEVPPLRSEDDEGEQVP